MSEAVIVAATRTAVGKAIKGTLAATRPDDMAAVVVRGDLAQLRASGGNYALGTVTETCVGDDVAGTSVADPTTPLRISCRSAPEEVSSES